MAALLETNCPDLKLVARGKVRDIYDVDEHSLLFVATDRLSAFDVVMKTGIPGKGKILTQLSEFWFDLLKDVMPNHVITTDMDKMPANVQKYRDQLLNRCMLVRRLTILPVEAIVRGYITGSAMNEYKAKGTVCDMKLPEGLVESQELPQPLFTPSTKAEIGDHDENIHPDKLHAIIGEARAQEVAKAAVHVYNTAREFGKAKGVIIADTKFEFGVNEAGVLTLADEVLTPDSSRFWPADVYTPGKTQPSFDKQYVRDYLKSIGFDNKTPVELPQTVVDNTLAKYIEVYKILTGKTPVF
ncbi:hypothetical protein BC831DRAFT_470225 [Entophlyctis helioformis]|nr:hypothetical protein BC831DRAFT_470225 [Entophlyctis helioformis]